VQLSRVAFVELSRTARDQWMEHKIRSLWLHFLMQIQDSLQDDSRLIMKIHPRQEYEIPRGYLGLRSSAFDWLQVALCREI
jgi:hypothetical protein